MAQRHAHSQPIETHGLASHNRTIWPSPTPTANQYKHMAQRRIIETYGLAPRPQPKNKKIGPHNSRATAAPSRLADSFVCPGGCGLPTTYVSCELCVVRIMCRANSSLIIMKLLCSSE